MKNSNNFKYDSQEKSFNHDCKPSDKHENNNDIDMENNNNVNNILNIVYYSPESKIIKILQYFV